MQFLSTKKKSIYDAKNQSEIKEQLVLTTFLIVGIEKVLLNQHFE